jgi:uncharacterized membrane protein
MRSPRIRLHSSRIAAVLVAAMFLAFVPAAWAAKTETFVPTIVQYPGSTSTTARGINNSGDIVGTYVCAAACVNPVTGETSTPGTHGFLLQAGVYARIDVPGGSGTVARGISEQGTIVGHYNVGAVTHGFAYFEGLYRYPIDAPAEDFDHPASPLRDTLPVRISPEGDIVGCFHEDGQTMTTMHGWLLHNGNFTVLVTPHSADDGSSRDPDTMNNGVAPTGEIVGFYLSSGVSYIAKRNVIAATFTFEGNLFTLAWDVNARGDIVGVHGDNQANTVGVPVNPHGFLRTKHAEYTSLDVQGAINTQVFGVNVRRDIVGAYTDATGTHGFVYRLKRDNRDGDDRDDRDEKDPYIAAADRTYTSAHQMRVQPRLNRWKPDR